MDPEDNGAGPSVRASDDGVGRIHFGGVTHCRDIDHHHHCPTWYDDPRPCSGRSQGFADAVPVRTLLEGLERIPPGIFVLILALLAAVFAVSIRRRYNHVLVVHRRIHTSAISNTWWMRYFIVTALQASLHLARIIYGMPGSVCDVVLFYLQMYARVTALAVLCVAIDYQVRHRSKNQETAAGLLLRASSGAFSKGHIQGAPDTKLLLRSSFSTMSESELYVRKARAYYWVCALALVINTVVLLVDACVRLLTEELQWIYFGSTWVILLSLLYFALVVVFTEGDVDDGPTWSDKLGFLGGVVLVLLYDGLPPAGWKWLLPDGCKLAFLSWYNVIELMNIVACILFFVFMQREFRRSKEACIHQTVGHIRQSTARQHNRI